MPRTDKIREGSARDSAGFPLARFLPRRNDRALRLSILLPLIVLLILVLSGIACGEGTTQTDDSGQPPEPTPTPSSPVEAPVPPTPTVHHLSRPGDTPATYLLLSDPTSAESADERRAMDGDDYMRNRYERPFTPIEMDYRPDLDITRAEIAFDSEWIYFSIELVGVDPTTGRIMGAYAVELDLDADGDGDWLITSTMPGDSTWSTNGVRALYDANDDVGGETAMGADPPPQEGDAFEVLSFDQGQGEDPDAAWSRQMPSASERVQIAIKRSLIGGDSSFLWGVWAADVEIFMEVFDLNDSYTLAEAGSPMANSVNYPVKAVALVDNTCRMYSGFTPTGHEPGLCPVFGTIQNCIFHDVLIKPGDVIIAGRMVHPNPILSNVMPGTYSFYDTDVGGPDPILTATLHPAGLIQITTDGFMNTYDCP